MKNILSILEIVEGRLPILHFAEELEDTEDIKETPKAESIEETPAKPFTMPDAEQLDFRAVLKSKV